MLEIPIGNGILYAHTKLRMHTENDPGHPFNLLCYACVTIPFAMDIDIVPLDFIWLCHRSGIRVQFRGSRDPFFVCAYNKSFSNYDSLDSFNTVFPGNNH